MARKLRIEYPGAIYHIRSRGNKRGNIFLCDDDRRTFLKLLNETAEKFGWLCAAYCLMDNHYHLLIKTIQATLSSGMHWLNGVYTQRFNGRHNQVGHLFQGRFKDSIVQDGVYLQVVSRYIALNPVQACMVDLPENWAWSSHREMLGLDKPIDCLESGLVLNGFGKTVALARKEYEQFVLAGIGLDEEYDMCRSIIGEDWFVKTHQSLVGDRVSNREHPIVQRFVDRPSLGKIFSNSGTGISRLKQRETRNFSIYKAVERYGYTHRDVAKYVGLHYASVSKIASELKRQHSGRDLDFLP